MRHVCHDLRAVGIGGEARRDSRGGAPSRASPPPFDVRPCTFRPACEQPAHDDDACYFHAKVRDGHIVSTRSTAPTRSTKIEPVHLTESERQDAERRRDRYYDRLMRELGRHREADERARQRHEDEWARLTAYR